MAANDRGKFVTYCMREYGWDEDKATMMVNECIDRFLVLKKKDKDYKGTKLMPSPEIAMAWHSLIVHTDAYLSLCKGRLIHCDPSIDAQDINDDMHARFYDTRKRYREEFKVDPPKSLWPSSLAGPRVLHRAIFKFKDLTVRMFINPRGSFDETVEKVKLAFLKKVGDPKIQSEIRTSVLRLKTCDGVLQKTFPVLYTNAEIVYYLSSTYQTSMFFKNQSTSYFTCYLNKPIASAFNRFCQIQGFDPDDYMLTFAGKIVTSESRTFDELNIPGNTTLFMSGKVRGC